MCTSWLGISSSQKPTEHQPHNTAPWQLRVTAEAYRERQEQKGKNEVKSEEKSKKHFFLNGEKLGVIHFVSNSGTYRICSLLIVTLITNSPADNLGIALLAGVSPFGPYKPNQGKKEHLRCTHYVCMYYVYMYYVLSGLSLRLLLLSISCKHCHSSYYIM